MPEVIVRPPAQLRARPGDEELTIQQVEQISLFKGLSRRPDQWRTAESFGRDDLLLLAKVLDRAHTWILDQGRAEDIPS